MATPPPITITTPDESLSFQSMTGEEEIGRLFEYQVELFGLEKQVKADQLLGKVATVTLDLEDKGKRYFNGFICAFSYLGRVAPFSEYGRYRATLRPWLWFLTRVTDCRIFQKMKVNDIILAIFRDNHFTDFKDTLTRKDDYKPREYCVQYRESCFSFVSRLMEQEGIYYYFEHENGKHTLILADSPSHVPFPNYTQFQFGSADTRTSWRGDFVDGWSHVAQIQPGVVTLNDYDFKDPKKMMLATQPGAAPHADHASYEIYDYPGEYVENRAEGERYAGLRMQELSAQYEQVEGHGYVRGVAPGHTFTLKDHYIPSEDKEYLVIAAHYQISTDPQTQMFSVSFRAIDNTKQYRTPRVTPKPIVHGSQTAKVVGKASHEIWTDPENFNRVMVQFHWDRYSKGDETSSCWVRVSQAWAGPNWGSIHIPRIGQEVVVDFLEGDPDRPLITGRVYNKDNMPPYPDKPTQSGIKSRSTMHGTEDNFNELRFDDKKGAELVHIQAERDHETLVKHDQRITVNNTLTETYKAGRETTVEKFDDTTVKGGNKNITVEKQYNLKADTLNLKAASDIFIQVGGAIIHIDKTGTISVKGTMVKLNSP
jgi:type VI secretion system secreted protein VgrG